MLNTRRHYDLLMVGDIHIINHHHIYYTPVIQRSEYLFCICPNPNFEFAEPYFGVANSINVLFPDVNLTTNSWKVWKYKINIEYQTEENRVMTTETDYCVLIGQYRQFVGATMVGIGVLSVVTNSRYRRHYVS